MKDLLSLNYFRKMRLLLASRIIFPVLAVIVISAFAANAQSVAPQATFPANAGTLGAIPDNTGTGCGLTPATPRDVTFTVSGLTGNVSTVAIDFNAGHTWVNDLAVTLIAPGGSPSHLLFARTGATTAADCGAALGGSNDLIAANNYAFIDTASTTWWTRVAAGTPVAGGQNRTQATGGAAGTPPVTSLNTTFSGLTPAQANGTWTLRFQDQGGGDSGTVTAANLTITVLTAPGDAANDINGDGKSDYTVVRNVGGGASGQIRWFYNTNGTGDPTVALDWGLANDGFFLLEDYDGDNKDDITVWRAGTATFYTLLSQTMTARIDQFGQTGDDPTIAGDYDGDGKADSAVYRAGAMAGLPSTWYYRGSLTPANVTAIPWGQNGDFPAPGDYDGDGKMDFVIQRNNGGGQAAFWRRLANGSATVTPFGTPTDVIVPGDYDGDGKTDIATVRGVSGNYQWMYLSSLNSSINYITFGASATDFFAQGDYNGDGKTDVAIWRPSATPGGSFYVSRDTVSGAVQFFTFGQNGDYPVNNWNRH